ncbi:MAG: glycosyltransferase [Mesorhizobium sp.]|uniref:glycosyltransferase n=1 Tax=unclassified Mesorhizobium TaxID=325217 RepID=UPI000FCB8566|nr:MULTISPECIES: glycosyltransferase [unclassified Mesorhizobium]RVD18675.1 glycosyltransferase [Mesorhizobium sp. M7A.F.Ca.ET.027.02.1.1]RVD65767.1 glycosyltransferase [Mesorhizobium sp. M7A.F.Ca.ET.027.03.2.1]RWD10853.1 MAG: glycosyltransferase [Mesorhizobium sp.]RWP14063.1 MAG: glycosyltransferase [Mesorhizobium sp.]
MTNKNREHKIAVLVPCYNEELTIADVIHDFKSHLPAADVYVYDNNSSDDTYNASVRSGAIVRKEKSQGKGNVVRRMFSDIEADIYILVDGDGTYDASVAQRLIDELCSGPYDMVNVARVAENSDAYRSGHEWGNKLLTGLVRRIFGAATTDMLSGYKAFSRRYAKSFPALSTGFEIETELVVHALDLRLPQSEITAPYRERPTGSASKLRTYSDGLRILRLIGFLVKEERPLAFFSIVAGILAMLSLLIGASVIIEFMETGLVPRLPTAVLATGIMVSALLSLSSGFILDTVTRGRREAKRLAYLRYPAP